MSLRERDRLVVLRQLADGAMTNAAAAERMGLSVRQVRRLRRAWEGLGDAAVVHGHRGRRPNNAKPAAIRQRALERAREPDFHDFGPTLLAEHLSEDRRIGPLVSDTLRRWMIEDALWVVSGRRHRHRKSRPRRTAFGELVQMDTSEHAWLEDRYEGPVALIKMIDDATNRILMARFVPRDTGSANRQLLIDYLQRFGRPLAIYTDRAGHFGNRRRPRRATVEDQERQETNSIIRRALTALNIRLIRANSPQAKGRIERDFGTSQDRLIKEMRLARIASLEDANAYLAGSYIPFWNRRFGVTAADPADAHRDLPADTDLGRLFARTQTRIVTRAFTVRWQNQKLQIPHEQAAGIQPRDVIHVEVRLDGSTRFRHQELYLDLELVEEFVVPARTARRILPPAAPAPPAEPRPKRRPSADHPWRRTNMKFAGPRSTPAAARPALTSP